MVEFLIYCEWVYSTKYIVPRYPCAAYCPVAGLLLFPNVGQQHFSIPRTVSRRGPCVITEPNTKLPRGIYRLIASRLHNLTTTVFSFRFKAVRAKKTFSMDFRQQHFSLFVFNRVNIMEKPKLIFSKAFQLMQ